MMAWCRTIFITLGVGMALVGHAQQKCRWIKTFNQDFRLDSLSVIPASIEIDAEEELRYSYDSNHGLLYVTYEGKQDSVKICYKTIPYQLFKTYYERDPALESSSPSISESEANDAVVTESSGQREELFATENLQKYGSITRGISFGNNQDVVVNSALNLQMDGYLTDDIQVRASITDQNIPYQPEGNTAQIQDFDNVLVELYNDDFSLKAGDVVFKERPSHFLKFYKNVQGGLLNATYKTGENSRATTTFGASVAKGKFASLTLDVKEGVSGPYRIEIPGASRLAIILANSEKVFLNGNLLKRGYDYDYIIDYNRAEITFTTDVLITKQSRVKIDVEYADQNYSRNIVNGGHYQEWEKFGLFVNYYSESDNRNNPLKYELNDDDKLRLSQIGDELEQAYKDGTNKASYNPQKIQYYLKDTVTVDNQLVRVYEYARYRREDVYNVTFSDVGQGSGAYSPQESLANGRVFQWVGAGKGSYLPLRPITPPTAKKMTNIGGHYDISAHEQVNFEWAFSEQDLNLYSELDSEDDNGQAIKLGFESQERKFESITDYVFSTALQYEFTDRYFQSIDRFRRIEFNRDWSYDPLAQQDKSNDHIFQAQVSGQKNARNAFKYNFSRRKRGAVVDGYQHTFDLNQTWGPAVIEGNFFHLTNELSNRSSKWHRVNADISFPTAILVPGYQWNINKNKVFYNPGDSVTASADYFDEHVFYIRSNDTLATQFRLDYRLRKDQLPVEGMLQEADEAQTLSFTFSDNHWEHHRLELSGTYRKLDQLLGEARGETEETVLSRIDWQADALKDHVRSDLNLAIGNGRELRRDFSFVEVPTGEGTHTWRDDNGNGLQELNEFYLAVLPDERSYIKILTPTNEFVEAFVNNFNYRLQLNMPRNWKDEPGWKSFLSRFSNITYFNSNKKFTNSDLGVRFFPFTSNIEDEEVLASRQKANTRLFYNRSNTGFGMDVGALLLENKQLLSGGFENRSNREISANARLTVQHTYTVKLKLAEEQLSNASDFLKGRNYDVREWVVEPEVSWQPNPKMRIAGKYSYRSKNAPDGDESAYAIINEGNLDWRYSQVNNLVISGFVRYTDINFKGTERSPIGYELLEALRPGQNFAWNLSLQKKLISGLQISINYDGRKSEGNDLIHIGRMQVSALF